MVCIGLKFSCGALVGRFGRVLWRKVQRRGHRPEFFKYFFHILLKVLKILKDASVNLDKIKKNSR